MSSAKGALPWVWLRSHWLQGAWNPERGQNVGFAFALTPVLTRVWRGAEDELGALHRHLEAFHSQPFLASACLGAAARLEEDMAAAPKSERPAREARLRELKASLAGTCATLGDGLFWSTLRPFCAVLAAAIWAMAAFWVWYGQSLREDVYTPLPAAVFLAGSLMYLLVFNAFSQTARIGGLRLGYRNGAETGAALKRLPFKAWENALRWTGFSLAALAAAGYLLVSGARGEWWVLVAALGVAALKFWDFSVLAVYASAVLICVFIAVIRP